jgi:hypothetical protein
MGGVISALNVLQGDLPSVESYGNIISGPGMNACPSRKVKRERASGRVNRSPELWTGFPRESGFLNSFNFLPVSFFLFPNRLCSSIKIVGLAPKEIYFSFFNINKEDIFLAEFYF